MKTASHIQKKLSGLTAVSRSRIALRRQLWVWPILGALVFAAVGWWVQDSVEKAMRENLAGELKTILDADVEALKVWTNDQKAIARSVAHSPAIRPLVQQLVTLGDQKDATAATLVQSPALGQLRSLLTPYLENFGFTDFFVISPSVQVLACKDNGPIKNLRIDGYRRSFLEQVLRSGAAVSRPFRTAVLLPDARGELRAGAPTIFAAAAVPDQQGKPIAVLSLRIRPEAQFTDILHTARFGESGETYAFSKEGLLLSQSRFDNDLKRLGLLPDLPDSQSILTLEVRDPQVNMMEAERPSLSRSEQPLTKLAQQAVAGGAGVVMDAYRDYRGVPSVGAWRWLPEYGFAIATEVDIDDAFRPLYILRRAIWILLTLLILSGAAIFFAMVVVARHQRRTERAEKEIKQLGQYTLEEKIGAGGMGSVYRARHAFLRRPTAVKMLDMDKVTEGALARFEREVQLTSRLNHPNTIAVYDYGRTPEGVFYYAMEFLQGIDLEDLVQKYGPLPEGRVVRILEQVCGSLAEAHEIGLIHRDIKPANIILSCRAGISDFVKVLDFGLVKAPDTDAEAKITQANVTLGTPHYMSPEAVEHPERVSALSDIYAIGAVGYFLLSGTPVFSGKTIMDICMKHVRAIPEPLSKRLGRPMNPSLEALILRCLAKDPNGRPQRTSALRQALAELDIANSWTGEDANAWWTEFNARADVRAQAAQADQAMPTAASHTTKKA